MNKPSKITRASAAIAFSSIMGSVLALAGLLVGMYLWDHFGTTPRDPDDTDAYLFGLLVGGFVGLVGVVTLLRKLWPRAAPKDIKSSQGERAP